MVAKAENGHVNIQELFKFNFIAKYNIRSSEKDSEKNMVLCKKGDDITPFDGMYYIVQYIPRDPSPNHETLYYFKKSMLACKFCISTQEID